MEWQKQKIQSITQRTATLPNLFPFGKKRIWSAILKIGSIFGNSQVKSRLANNYY